MTPEAQNLLEIGVGNEYRGDDGAGIVASRRLRGQLPAQIGVLEQSGEGAALMQAWLGAAWVVVIDAARSGAAPGTLHRLDARAGKIPSGFFHYSTHAFSVAEAVELARTLGQLPPHLILYGIEGRSFRQGIGLSAEVNAAVDEAVARVAEEVSAASWALGSCS